MGVESEVCEAAGLSVDEGDGVAEGVAPVEGAALSAMQVLPLQE